MGDGSTDRKVAIITGAGSGIGRATAQLLAEQGVAIVAVGRRTEPLEALRADLVEKVPVSILPLDVCADETPEAAVGEAMARFGRLDYLVNNAGIGMPSPVHETTDELLDTFLNVLLRAPFRFCREALKVMGRGAAVVNLASTFALVGGLRGGAYSAAKAGIIGLSQHMAAQYGRSGIRTNVVAPGVLETAMTAPVWEAPRFRRMNFDMTPSDRTGRAEDAAEAICFLLSDKACFINGQVIVVDGGWSATRYLSDEAITAVPAPK